MVSGDKNCYIVIVFMHALQFYCSIISLTKKIMLYSSCSEGIPTFVSAAGLRFHMKRSTATPSNVAFMSSCGHKRSVQDLTQSKGRASSAASCVANAGSPKTETRVSSLK